MANEQTRTLRIIVEDNTTSKNPIPCKAKIWVRGWGDMLLKHRSQGQAYEVYIGVHEADICIHPGYVHREHPGYTFRYELPPVGHKEGSAAYYAVGTLYVEFFDDSIRVHGVPIGVKVLRFDRDDRPKDVIEFESLEKRVTALEQKSHADRWETGGPIGE